MVRGEWTATDAGRKDVTPKKMLMKIIKNNMGGALSARPSLDERSISALYIKCNRVHKMFTNFFS